MIQESRPNRSRKEKQYTKIWQLYEPVTYANLSINMYKAKLLYMYAGLITNNHITIFNFSST